MNRKQVIRLTENQFHQIVKECVKSVFNEGRYNNQHKLYNPFDQLVYMIALDNQNADVINNENNQTDINDYMDSMMFALKNGFTYAHWVHALEETEKYLADDEKYQSWVLWNSIARQVHDEEFSEQK